MISGNSLSTVGTEDAQSLRSLLVNPTSKLY